MKEHIPSCLKSIYWKYIIKNKYGRHNKIGKNTIISKDFFCGVNCKIGSDVAIGKNVILGNGVKIGSSVILGNLEIGDNSFIEGRVIVTGHGTGKIKIGKECYIGIYNILDWSNDITIGDYVHIAGPSTGIWTHSSAKMCLNSIPLNKKTEEFRPTAPIIIESNVYIGGNCTIYPGVTIGHHSIIAPNSAVTKNVESYSLFGGVPAKKIKDLSQ
jgi:acetyltransferase-like isoleucine patch superfamily enzyme